MGVYNTGCSDLKVTPDKGYILAGSYLPGTSGSSIKAFLIKLNVTGAIEWQKTINIDTAPAQTFTLVPRKVLITADSGYCIFMTYGGSFLADGNMVVRFDKNGNLIWYKRLNFFTPGQVVIDATQTSDNGFAFISVGSFTFRVCKMDWAGNINWTKQFLSSPIPGSSISAAGITELNNSLYVTGGGSGISGFNYLTTLMKIDIATGQYIWCKTYGVNTSYSGLAFGPIAVSNNKLVVSGSFDTDQPTAKQGIFYFLPDGTLEKSLKITSSSNTILANSLFHSLSLSKDGYYGGHTLTYYNTTTNNVYDTAGVTFRIDQNGQLVWQKRPFNFQGGESLAAIHNTDDGGFVAAGPRLLGTPANQSIYIIKGDSAGLAGNCTSTPAGITITSVSLPVESVTLNQVNSLVEGVTDIGIHTIETQYSREIRCAEDTVCTSINILGEVSICDQNNHYVYKISRSSGCQLPVTWSVSNPGIANIIALTDTSVTIQYLQAGTLTLYASIQFPCFTITNSIPIRVFYTPPPLDLGPDLSLCSNGFYELHAGSGFRNYLWQDGAVDSIYKVTLPGLYHVTVIDSCGRAFSDTVLVQGGPAAPLNIGNDTTICLNDTLTLHATSGFISYHWSPGYNISSTTNATTSVFPAIDTAYIITAIKGPGCIVQDTIQISLYPTPHIYLGNDTSLCKGNHLLLDAGPGFQNYLWNTGETTRQIFASLKTIYSVTATDTYGCKAADSLEIYKVFPIPSLHLPKDSFLCQGKTLLLNAGTGYTSYLWQDGSTNSTFSVLTTGSYWVTVRDINNCSANSDTTIIRYIEPAPANFLISDTSLCRNQSLFLTINTSYTNYLWSTGERSNSIIISQAGNYWLTVTNSKGCQATENLTVIAKNCFSEIYFPNAFTPNNDGKNDVYRPYLFGESDYFNLTIFNRYGQIVFYSEKPENGWDGRLSGKLQDAGTYTWQAHYRIRGKKDETESGTLLLIR